MANCSIFAWVLTWKASLDRSLEIFEPFDGCRLDGLEELKPDDWKGIVVVELFRNLVAQIDLERRQQEGPSRFVVRAVVLVVLGDLAFNQGLCRLNGVAGVGFDHVCHLRCIQRILEVCDGIHASVGEVVPDRVLECDEIVGWLEGVLEASAAVVVTFLGGRDVDWTELIRRRAVKGMIC